VHGSSWNNTSIFAVKEKPTAAANDCCSTFLGLVGEGAGGWRRRLQREILPRTLALGNTAARPAGLGRVRMPRATSIHAFMPLGFCWGFPKGMKKEVMPLEETQ
jgi:hypothetical protein